jgi:hypothetical protein
MGILEPEGQVFSLPMPGLEPDNLLAFMALMGLLRALEVARPDWRPRASWKGPPWIAHLELAVHADRNEAARAANDGILTLVMHFTSIRTIVKTLFYFGRVSDLRPADAKRSVEAALASAPWSRLRKNGDLQAAPLVLMFGQGHQNFLERLIDVPSGTLPSRLRKLKTPPDMTAPAKIAEALFQAWRREDDADGFRWDPADDQLYALRYEDPSLSGAALTTIGANRLAAIGFLSFWTVPSHWEVQSVGGVREDNA